jgi:hypothetical protein
MSIADLVRAPRLRVCSAIPDGLRCNVAASAAAGFGDGEGAACELALAGAGLGSEGAA